VWRIPVEALLAVGLHPGRSLPSVTPPGARPVAPPPQPVTPVGQDSVTIPRDRWDDVRLRLARAEAEAAERGLALADARLALRALTAGPRWAPDPQAPSPGAGPDPAASATGSPSAPTPSVAGPTGGALRTGPAHPIPPGAAGGLPSGPVGPREADSTALGVNPVGTDPTVPTDPVPADPVPADVVAARNLAARTGGYVPAAAPVKKRRWWRST
jgi:hypothetical protein